MMNELNWLSVDPRIKYYALILIFKIKNGLALAYMNEKITVLNEIHSRNTKHRNDFRLPLARTEQVKMDLFYTGINTKCSPNCCEK